jgi:hypothetical protein
MNTARYQIAGTGTQTAALGFGGNPGTGAVGATEEYDGTSWATSPGNLNTARRASAGAGTSSSAIGFGGYSAGYPAFTATEEYDGTSWTFSCNFKTARSYLSGAGTVSASSSNWWIYTWIKFNCNRRMDRCRSTINSYNHSFLTLYLSI